MFTTVIDTKLETHKDPNSDPKHPDPDPILNLMDPKQVTCPLFLEYRLRIAR